MGLSRLLLHVARVGSLLSSIGSARAAPDELTNQTVSTKPHILFIVADDLGFGDLGYTGSDIKTPVIDGLATAGQILGHYYVMHCCSPTRSALHTGRYNIRYGLQTQVIPNNKAYGLSLEETLMPQYMKRLGYKTHAVGKWHLGLFKWEYTPTFRGYDSFLGYYSGSQDYFTHRDSGFDLHLDIGPNCGQNCSQPQLQLNGTYSTHIYANRAVTILAEHPSASDPLFLYMPFQSVHCPIEAPASYVEPYLQLDPNRQKFAGMLAALDEAVGIVVGAFEKKEMWDNTLTVFSTDNGGPVGSKDGEHPSGIGCATGSQNWPLRGGKGAYYQGGVRGTAWVHGKMLSPAAAGTHNFGLMHVTDWVPTLVEAAGGGDRAFPEWEWTLPLDGVSQWQMLTKNAPSARTDLLINIERDHPTTAPPSPGGHGCTGVGQYAVIRGSHKLLVGGGGLPNNWYHDGLPYNGTEPTPYGNDTCLVACATSGCASVPQVQLFDVLADEAERHNLAPSNPELVEQLMAVVTKYNSSTYVEALSQTMPIETSCPFNDERGVLTPCAN